MVIRTGVPEPLAERYSMLLDRAPDDAYRANLITFVNDLCAFARHLDVHQRLVRYGELLTVLEKAKTKRNPLADTKHCVRLVATMVEILLSLTGHMPTEAEVTEALDQCGIAHAEVIVRNVWYGNDRFHVEWLRMLPRTEPLREAMRRAG